MKCFFDVGKRLFVAATMLAAVIGFNCNVGLAAEDGMADFRKAYTAAPKANQNYSVEIDLLGPAFHADIETGGEIRADGFIWQGGTLEWDYTDHQTGTTAHQDIPVYWEKSSNAIDFYGKRGGVWYRDTLGSVPMWLVGTLLSRDQKELQDNMSAVKSVDVLQERETTKVLRVKFDSQSLANLIRNHAGQTKITPDGEQFIEYLAQGAAATEVTCDWTIDKATGETVTVSADLTKLMQNYAQSLLQGSYQSKVTLSEDDKALLQTIGYYCNLRIYASKIGDNNPHLQKAKDNAIEARGAKDAAAGFLNDLEKDAVTSSVK